MTDLSYLSVDTLYFPESDVMDLLSSHLTSEMEDQALLIVGLAAHRDDVDIRPTSG